MYEFALNVTKGAADSTVVYGLLRSDVATVSIEVSQKRCSNSFYPPKACLSRDALQVVNVTHAVSPQLPRTANDAPMHSAKNKRHSWPASQPIAHLAIWYPLSSFTVCIQGLQNLRRTSHPPCRQVVSFEAPEVVVATSDGGVKLDPTRKIVLYGGVVDPSSGVVEQSGDLLWSQVGNISCSTPVPTVPP